MSHHFGNAPDGSAAEALFGPGIDQDGLIACFNCDIEY